MANMNNLGLVGDIQQKMAELDTSLKSLRRTGTAYAEAERNYRVALRQKALVLKDEGMAIGMITLTVYGVPEIAELRFRRDTAEAVYKANQEAINVIKLELRIIEEQLKREWGNDTE